MNKITIIDYDVGNIFSLKNAFEACGADVVITDKKKDILKSKKIVLPGVGSFGNAIDELGKRDLKKVLMDCAINNHIILGICLGMQLFF